MKITTMIEVVSALHLSAYVDSAFRQRGGIMMVGPPGSLGSSIIKILSTHPYAMVASDLNVQQLIRLRDDVCSKRITTIGFLDFEKLYQRAQTTSSNVEGHLKAFVDEGFSRASFEDQRAVSMSARAAIIGKMTQGFYLKMFGDWIDNGFARRFLWCVYRLKNPDIIEKAIHTQRIISIGSSNGFVLRTPENGKIPFDVSENESKELRRFLNFQRSGVETPLITIGKILSVLKWKFKKEKAWTIISDFAECLSASGAEMEV